MSGICCTATATWCTGSGSIGAVLVGGMLVSTISINCGYWMSTSTPGILILSTSDVSTPGIPIWSTLYGSTIGISTSQFERPRLLVKTNCSGWSLPRALTQGIILSVIGITSQLCQTNLFPVLSTINLKRPCRFLLGPREIAPSVLGFWLLWGASSSFTWEYCAIWRLKCFL